MFDTVHPTRLRCPFHSIPPTNPAQTQFNPHTLLSVSSSCQFHHNLLHCIICGVSPAFVVTQIRSFLILSNFVTPHINLDLISFTSKFFTCACLSANVSATYIIAGLPIGFCFPLDLKLIIRSNSAPDTLFQFFQPSSTVRETG